MSSLGCVRKYSPCSASGYFQEGTKRPQNGLRVRQARLARGEVVMKILVVEDNKKVASFIEKGLREEGYAVDVAHDGVDGPSRTALGWGRYRPRFP